MRELVFTRGLIPGRTEQPSEFYSQRYFKGETRDIGGQPYLDPNSEYRFKFQDLLAWLGNSVVNGRVLDIGCGPNHLGYWSEKLGKPFRIVGMDFSDIVFEAFRSLETRVVAGTAPELPFRSDHFEAVMLSDILEHLSPEHATTALNEVCRVLKPKGRAFLNIPNRLAWKNSALYNDPSHVWLPTIKEVHELLTDTGFCEGSFQTYTRGFPFSLTFRRITRIDLHFPYFGTSIRVSAQKPSG